MERWRVHKFGGSSVADARCMERVAAILEHDPRRRLAVVLSACRGVTDALLGVVTAAEQQAGDVPERLTAIRQRHVDIAETLLNPDDRREFIETLDQDIRDVQGSLDTVRLIRSAPDAVRDLVVGFGEIWSTRLFTRYLTSRGRRPGRVRWLDARDVIRVEWGTLGPAVRWPESRDNARLATQPEADETLIVTGFICVLLQVDVFTVREKTYFGAAFMKSATAPVALDQWFAISS